MTQGPTAVTGGQEKGGAAPVKVARSPASVRTAVGGGVHRQRDARGSGKGTAHLLMFPRGLYGFPGPLRFQVHDVPESGYLFRVLQTVGKQKLVFALVDAALFLNYLPEARPEDLAEVGLPSAEEGIWMVIASIPSSLSEATVNLKAPLLINPFSRVAKQVILEADYHVRQPLVSR